MGEVADLGVGFGALSTADYGAMQFCLSLNFHPYKAWNTNVRVSFGRMYKHTLLAITVFLTSSCSVARDSVSTTAIDPANTCSVLNKNLPDRLTAIRHIGRLRKEKTGGDAGLCEHQAEECTIHTMEFRGLTLELLANKRTQDAFPLVLKLSSSRWSFLGDIKIGQRLEVLEKHYGVTISRDVSPIVLEGECTPLTIWHVNGRLTQLKLDCQACI